MAKQEYKILEFHGGTNNKFDPRDIADNQNAQASLSIRRPGRLATEGGFRNTYYHTSVNGKSVNNVDGTLSFKAGYGLNMFSHDYNMDATPVENDNFFIVTNDSVDIDIYDPNKSGGAGWTDAKFKLGSRIATVKPEYFNVDGALRACDSNFSVTDLTIDTNAVISKNDVVLTTESGTIATGSIIQINQEIMYVTSGSSTSTNITVIRGFANTKITTHAHNSVIYYVNIPKYFGHIKQDRLFECATSNSINTWVEDVQTPQPPNNTRKSDGTSGTLANSAGVQSLRVYDEITSSTTNYPTESEKVVLEFGDSAPDYGIIKVDMTADSDFIAITTSAEHGLTNGDEIVISNVTSEITGLSGLAGTHTVSSRVDENIFEIEMVDHSINADIDWTDTEYAAIASSGWEDYTSSVAGTIKAKIDESEVQSSGQRWVHITGITGVTSFNGVKLTTRVDGDEFYFKDTNHADASSAAVGGKVQQLLATITKPGEDAIDEDLKRKWNFAMSFTYDGPAQEVQESLLTQGHKITESIASDGTSNLLNTSGGTLANDATAIVIDDTSVFSAGDVIIIESEQIQIGVIDNGTNLSSCVRGFNNSAAATHADNLQISLLEELTPTATVDWTGKTVAQKAVIKTVYNHGVDEKTWNARINGFKIYMKDVTKVDASKEWRLFSEVNFNKGTYTIFAAGDSELILEQPGTWSSDGAICTVSSGTDITIKPVDTYLSENLFTEETIIDAQYKCAETVGRRTYIGNIRQGGRTYPDRMLRTPVNKFDTFPETNFIDVAIGDGDKITALKSFGDRLLQYKKNTVYIINISGESEVLEAEYPSAGIEFPSQVCKTNSGIAWINDSGLWFFDGQSVQNLTRHIEDDGYTLTNTTPDIATIGFDKKNNRLIYATDIENGADTKIYIYDLDLKAYQSYHKGLFPFSGSSANYYTNMINDRDGKLLIGYVDSSSANKGELNIYEWSNSSLGDAYHFGDYFLSKDIDFGSPTARKKIYKIYITYKCTGHSGIKVQYATNGGSSFSDFSSSSSTNYSIGALENSSGEWQVAELKPSTSINNIKSIQLKLTNEDGLSVHSSGTCNDATGANTTTLRLHQTDASTTGDIYNNYNIGITGGTARYNVRLISDYAALGKIVTLSSAMVDHGYGNVIDTTTTYKIGVVPADFEINDISIIFRAKRVK
jgi:hypothetical protein